MASARDRWENDRRALRLSAVCGVCLTNLLDELIQVVLFIHVIGFSGNVLGWQCLLIRHAGYLVVVRNSESIVRVFASVCISALILIMLQKLLHLANRLTLNLVQSFVDLKHRNANLVWYRNLSGRVLYQVCYFEL